MERTARALSFMRGNVLVLTTCSTLWRISIDVIWPFLALYIIALGGDYETVGLVMAVGNLASLILYPLGGYLADYKGRIKSDGLYDLRLQPHLPHLRLHGQLGLGGSRPLRAEPDNLLYPRDAGADG